MEIVVVDDGSSDGTPDLLRRRYGDRIRLLVNPTRSGQSRATNACIGQARGKFVKFLHHDDTLEPSSVSRLVDALTRHGSAGMSFGRRKVLIDHDAPEGRRWLERYGRVHEGFTSLQPLNHGRRLFEELLANGFQDNWIGEPTSVMLRRECLERLGGFHLYVQHPADLDLWLRVMAHYDVAFVDEQLSTYRHLGDSHTDRGRRRGLHWLDRLWMLEGLLSYRDLARDYPELARMRAAERRMAFRTAARSALPPLADAPPLGRFVLYLAYRARRPFGASELFGRVERAT